MRPRAEIMKGYALKYLIELTPETAEPTDENLRHALKHCALPVKDEWMDEIREHLTPEDIKMGLHWYETRKEERDANG